MFAPDRSLVLLLLHLFHCVNTSPVLTHTPSPLRPLQISPPSSSPTILPSPPPSSLTIPTPSRHTTSNSGESVKHAQCPLVISPSRLVVRFEDPFTVNCSVTATGFFFLGWEVSLAKPEPTVSHFLVWSVNKMTEWNMKPACFRLVDTEGQCQRNLSLVVYKPPDRVLLRLGNHTGPMLEGHQYELQCAVLGVAPVENLIVTFYREQTTLGQLRSKNTTKEPVNETFSLGVSPGKDHNTLQYWCEAKLELGPEGPRHPPVVTSPRVTASIQFGPELACPRKLQVREGEKLSCEVRGNPRPAVVWFRDGKEVGLPSHMSREHSGNYSIWAKGALQQRNFTVEVEVLSISGAANCNRHFLLAVLLIQVTLWLYTLY